MRLQNQQGNWIFEDKTWSTFPETGEGEDFIEVNKVGSFWANLHIFYQIIDVIQNFLKIFDFQKSLSKLGPTMEDFNS